jgi:membrane peptidoglycan carboxypeptidase
MDVVQNELTGVDHISVQELDTGGLKVVTTISRPMEVQLYKAVDANLKAVTQQGGTVPKYIRVGAEVQNPANGEILATYPGPGRNMTKKQCAEHDCYEDMAIYAREQVGSSFKPYVLSTAVSQGMNVQSSLLNATAFACVPPESVNSNTLSKDMSYYSADECAQNGLAGYYAVENDDGVPVGNAKNNWGINPQTALAQSSNVAFSDLAHKVGTRSIITMAHQFGVDTKASGLDGMVGEAGIALGIGSLTVNEQTTMLATIDDNGMYHQAHIVKYWQRFSDGTGTEQKPVLDTHEVLTPQQDAEVQYAMSQTTVSGTGTAAAVGFNRPIIAKTGTTSSFHSGFFIGAIPQYAMSVGIFTASQNDTNTSQSLLPLGNGFGGYWPAKIWNTFALAEFASLPVDNFQNPVFFGQKWIRVAPAKKKTVTCVVDGKKVKITLGGKVKACPKPKATPTPSPTPSRGHHHGGWPGNSPSPTPIFTQPTFPPVTGTPTPTVPPTGSGTPTGTPTSIPTTLPTTIPTTPSGGGPGGGGKGGG